VLHRADGWTDGKKRVVKRRTAGDEGVCRINTVTSQVAGPAMRIDTDRVRVVMTGSIRVDDGTMVATDTGTLKRAG
jgi:hypothetical protein